MKFLGIIPARGGSKGIPQKNLVEVAGHPLIYYTIQAAKDSKLLSDFIVTSDSQEILDYSSSQKTNFLRKRPDHHATDTASTVDVVLDTLGYIKNIIGEYPENFFLLQPTSPVRNGKLIDESITFFENQNINSLVGASLMTEHPYECVRENEGNWSFLEKPNGASRRQDYLENFYYINGSIYICNTLWFLKRKLFVCESETKLFIMGKECGVDIDELYDLYRAEAALNYINRRSSFEKSIS